MATANVKLYNQDGNVSGDIPAPAFLSASQDIAVAHQAFKATAANARQPIAHTKNRGEVSGGGIKPWKQKGTGRARQGSIRSPLWRHGGVTFGPRKTTDYSQKLNKKMKRQALEAALTAKLAADGLKIVDSLSFGTTKTKEVAHAMLALTGGKSALVVLSKDHAGSGRALANLARVSTVSASGLNTYDVLSHAVVLIEQPALAEIARS
ncbi:MAG: 50S ribosomal protein L4 [Patescibacteria group bacterium]|nr:50S ribosomal protein L4 [Patescibacteria group bacterium]